MSRANTTNALVVEADVPPQGATRLSKVGKCTIRVLAEGGSEPIYGSRSGHLKKDQWLVRGMEVPVTIDPDDPDSFEIDWDSIPSIEERAAADDPALADPAAAAARVREAMQTAGLSGPDSTAGSTDRFAEALERASQEPAPAGKTRAVVRVSSIRPRIVQAGSGTSGAGGPSQRTTEGKCNAVLSVNVPGQAPYAVYEKKFNRPRDKGDVSGAGLPALVSSSDPSDVEVLWDELPSLESQVGQRLSDKMQAAEATIGAAGGLEDQMVEAAKQAAAAGPPSNLGAGAGGLSPEMKAMMAQNAKLALQSTKDPAMRQMLIDQYKLAGIELDEEDLA